MKNKSMIAILFALSSTAHAALYDRGAGMIYDDALDVTWLQDANYAKTSGYSAADNTGAMTWYEAVDWAANLVYGGFDDWRLPTLTPLNGTAFDYDSSFYGQTDRGFNITSPNSELAYMYHVNLSNNGLYFPNGNPNPIVGVVSADFVDAGNGDVKSFVNLQNQAYWYGATYEDFSSGSYAWTFSYYSGSQGAHLKDGHEGDWYAWAVRDGDVTAVPLPMSAWLFVSTLGGFAALSRRKKAMANHSVFSV